MCVLTGEDLRRAGVTSIPEALRLVPGVQVARIDANKWAVSARGFNGRFAQKLLVLVDGRSAYTPLFSGVYWESQDVLLEDVDRIEVIRGPGATLWGANAVNGVINVITRPAGDTHGSLVSVATGTEERAAAAVRYGGRLGARGHGRAYLKAFARDGQAIDGRDSDADAWDVLRAGFRADWDLPGEATATLQGDAYDGSAGATYNSVLLVPPYSREYQADASLRGANLLARWRGPAAAGEATLQAYGDWTDRDEPVLTERRGTYDLDLQHRLSVGPGRELIWGLGYRYTHDRTRGSLSASFDPASRGTSLFSGFLQGDVRLADDRLHLSAGTKLEHSAYTGFEYQPGAR
ncbi:MAG: TonB-dependent receptor plug domain-containing protein, partial [Gemmatimonadota bacterium]